MRGKSHVRFAERNEETHKSRDLEVRFVPTPFSPLLANIALHGMEERIKQYAETLKGRNSKKRQALSLIRYADGFVIHEDLGVVPTCQQIIANWLSDIDWT